MNILPIDMNQQTMNNNIVFSEGNLFVTSHLRYVRVHVGQSQGIMSQISISPQSGSFIIFSTVAKK